ncbi:MAG: hypothetical protein AAFU78_06155 [Cyanobacteria bacterium J06633_2]
MQDPGFWEWFFADAAREKPLNDMGAIALKAIAYLTLLKASPYNSAGNDGTIDFFDQTQRFVADSNGS